jgi:glycosyltransferase involved in cell wall biosynthesis
MELNSALEDIHLTVIGIGEMKHLLKDCEYLGSVENHLLSDFYGKARIFVTTSEYEPFGMVVIEAQACGCPVVAWDLYSFREENTLPGKSSILIRKGDIEEMAKVIQSLYNNPRLIKEMGKAGRKFVEEKFPMEKVLLEEVKLMKRTQKEFLKEHLQKKV